MTTEPVSVQYDWCANGDQYHSLCRVSMTSIFGVETRCSCPNHESDNGSDNA